MSSIEQLVKMANDIGDFFRAEPQRADAVAGIANHLQRFWDPRMRRAIVAYAKEGGAGLDELVREAVATLKLPAASNP
jgi:formate dehydrogenase subunit delta